MLSSWDDQRVDSGLHSNTVFFSASTVRQWLYQTCTEYGYYQTFSGEGVPFPKAYNDIDYNYNLCKDLYGTECVSQTASSQ